MALEGLTNLLEQSLNYQATVYTQPFVSNESAFDNVYYVQTDKTSIPEDGILLYVPRINSVAKAGKLILSTGKSYNIVVETNNDVTVPLSKDMMIKNRLCIFRRTGTDKVVLCNAASQSNLILQKLEVIDSTVFNKKPSVKVEGNINNVTVVTSDELKALADRVAALERMIVTGELPPEEALRDAPAGTIYFQTED